MVNLSTFVFSAGALLVHYYAEKYRYSDLQDTLEDLEEDYGLPRINTWDFIIVGGGSAGCILAEQLSIAKHPFTVLLLEKGGNPVPSTYTEALIGAYAEHPEINDIYTSLPEKDANGYVRTYSAGRMLGGTGSHNGNTYTRGSPLMYDGWANITGDPSWKYLNMVKHYKEVEHFIGTLVNESDRQAFYGSTGPLTVNTAVPPHTTLWKEAAKELGYPFEDPNTLQRESFAPVQISMKNGLRDSSYTAFIKDIEEDGKVRQRPGFLTIHRYSNVENLLIPKDEEEKKKVYGVAYKRHGIPQIAYARKEVILSAGVFGTPAILFRSGIGKKELLEEAGIAVIADLPVGESLYSHVVVDATFTATNENLTNLYIPYISVEQSLMEFQGSPRRGPYSAYTRTQGFLSSSRAKAEGENEITDLGLFAIPSDRQSPNSPASFGGVSFLTLPRSKGHLFFNTTAYRLNNSLDSTELVMPDFATFKDPSDIKALVEGLEIVFKIFQHTQAMSPLKFVYNPSISWYSLPRPDRDPCLKFSFGTNEYWHCFVIQYADVVSESVGTCPMGPENDKNAVVDGKLKVRGVQGLRIVDGSIFPGPVSNAPNAPILAIAQKMAHEISQEYRLDRRGINRGYQS